jgi:hypothetical protein
MFKNICFIKLHVVRVINTVENHGLSDANFEQTLTNAFETGPLVPGSPQRKTILLPSCNLTPTKGKAAK